MAGGIATASAVAGIYDVLVGTVHDGSRYGAVLGDAIRVHRRDTDRVLGAEVSRGLGFRVGDRVGHLLPGGYLLSGVQAWGVGVPWPITEGWVPSVTIRPALARCA
ncbi:MAG: hypothetical protein QOF25_379 [Mycobacterium sp.]|jgi:hypothetical protein|nr:hypothetical protein [Mycobacterium sp.]